MGGYVEQGPPQSPNGQPLKRAAHHVKDSDLMLMQYVGKCQRNAVGISVHEQLEGRDP